MINIRFIPVLALFLAFSVSAKAQSTDYIGTPFTQGMQGKIYDGNAFITQIVSTNEAIANIVYLEQTEDPQAYQKAKMGVRPSKTYKPTNRQVLIRGLSFDGIADETKMAMPDTYTINGTYKYTTTSGALRTILVITPATSAKPPDTSHKQANK